LPSQGARDVPLRYPLLLGTFTFLFVLRVAGQVLVGLGEASFLPPFERWYSGLLPYWLLLPAQIALIVLMLKIVADFVRRNGYFVHLNPRTGIILQVLAGIYALSMVVRYVLTMALHPELRWFTGTIPIWFHFVLAAFIFTLGRYPLRHNLPPRPVP
jgi:hypothetical protein